MPPYSVEKRLFDICKRLEPDNISPHKPNVLVSGQIAFGVMNPTNTLLIKGNSLLMGHIFDENRKWDIPQDEFPDGSYALFRDGNEYFEIVSDATASRTIWYYMDENVFISSTSQRAIVMYIGSFEFDERIIPWMLSTGALGPDFSWDKRIRRVPADSSVILEKRTWTISSRSNPIMFNTIKRADAEHEKLLKESISNTFKSLDINYSNWALPLSGGVDSRAILCFLNESKPVSHNLKAITWGLESSQEIKGNDAYVASELANNFKLIHKYYHTDVSDEPLDVIINRFVKLGEGRTDNLKGYMDGFKVWKSIFEDAIEGIIRGDEGFGCNHYSSSTTIRINEGCALCSDFSNLRDYEKYGFPKQILPNNLKQKKGETQTAWKDRLFHEHDLPMEFSALSDLKLSYVEVINPLLSKKILLQVRELPDQLRNGKSLFKKIVISISPEIDFATSHATASSINILMQKQFVSKLKNEMSESETKKIFTTEFLDFISKGIKSEAISIKEKDISLSPKSIIKKFVPQFLKEAVKTKIMKPAVDGNILAFRVLLISRMNKILYEDSMLQKAN